MDPMAPVSQHLHSQDEVFPAAQDRRLAADVRLVCLEAAGPARSLVFDAATGQALRHGPSLDVTSDWPNNWVDIDSL